MALLLSAAREGDIDSVKRLLEEKADVNRSDDRGLTALMLASFEGHLEVVRTLLDSSAINVNQQNKRGWTALIACSFQGGSAVLAELLLNPEVDPNVQNKKGSTGLMAASYQGHLEAVRLLLAHPKIKIDVKDKEGQTAIDFAREKKHRKVLHCLTNPHRAVAEDYQLLAKQTRNLQLSLSNLGHNLQSSMSNLGQKYKESHSSNQLLRAENLQLLADVDNLQRKKREQDVLISSLQRTNRKLETDYGKAESRAWELEGLNMDLRRLYHKIKAEFEAGAARDGGKKAKDEYDAAVKQQVGAFRQQVESLANRCRTLEGELFREGSKESRDLVGYLKNRVTGLEKENASLMKENTSLLEKVTRLARKGMDTKEHEQKARHSRDFSAETDQDSLPESERKGSPPVDRPSKRKLSSTVNSDSKPASELQIEIKDLKSERDELQQKMASSSVELAGLQSKYECVQRERDWLREQLAQIQKSQQEIQHKNTVTLDNLARKLDDVDRNAKIYEEMGQFGPFVDIIEEEEPDPSPGHKKKRREESQKLETEMSEYLSKYSETIRAYETLKQEERALSASVFYNPELGIITPSGRNVGPLMGKSHPEYITMRQADLEALHEAARKKSAPNNHPRTNPRNPNSHTFSHERTAESPADRVGPPRGRELPHGRAAAREAGGGGTPGARASGFDQAVPTTERHRRASGGHHPGDRVHGRGIREIRPASFVGSSGSGGENAPVSGLEDQEVRGAGAQEKARLSREHHFDLGADSWAGDNPRGGRVSGDARRERHRRHTTGTTNLGADGGTGGPEAWNSLSEATSTGGFGPRGGGLAGSGNGDHPPIYSQQRAARSGESGFPDSIVADSVPGAGKPKKKQFDTSVKLRSRHRLRGDASRRSRHNSLPVNSIRTGSSAGTPTRGGEKFCGGASTPGGGDPKKRGRLFKQCTPADGVSEFKRPELRKGSVSNVYF